MCKTALDPAPILRYGTFISISKLPYVPSLSLPTPQSHHYPKLYINWITRCVLLGAWLFSFSYLWDSPILLHVTKIDYFLVTDSIPLYEHTTVYLSILLSTDFELFSMKSATSKILIHVLGCPFVSISIIAIVTNYHKLQTTYVSSQFLWGRGLNTA